MKKVIGSAFNSTASVLFKVALKNKKQGKMFGRSYIVRKREQLDRFEISKGECFRIFHCFKWAFYLQHKGAGSRPVGFNSIKDVNATETVV